MRFRVPSKTGDYSYRKWFAWRPVKVIAFNGKKPVVLWVWLEYVERCKIHRATYSEGIISHRYSYLPIDGIEKGG